MGDADVRDQLREAARAHRPDRERIMARVERGMAAPGDVRRGRHPVVAPWMRIAGATAAVAGVFVLAGYAVASAVQDDRAEQTVATRSTPPAASSSGASSSGASSSGAPQPSSAGLRARGTIDAGSNAYWAQSDVAFANDRALSVLTVELRVARTGGVTDTGNWRDLPAEDFAVSVRAEGRFLVYRWTLKAGRTARAGRHVFAAQYNHAEGARDPKGDSYTVRGVASGRQIEAHGGFA
ncbi:hypothetical protein AB0M87_23055 [Streptomyces sp. NPDC051320]|uniref:hypothetical protein n=1 Tax=Streptomyces sp. NPDC051320 TaxID=3154644 RepID=UPI0034184D30